MAPGIALWDVTTDLPTHKEKSWRTRKIGDVTEQYLHHSGRLGAPGFEGLRNSARYSARYRDWPGTAYHFWLPYDPVYDMDDRLVVYRCNADTTRTWHAGTGPNNRGLAVCLQGNTTAAPLSDGQEMALPRLLRYNAERLDVVTVLGHYEANYAGDGHAKPTCPGTHAVAWLVGRRSHLL